MMLRSTMSLPGRRVGRLELEFIHATICRVECSVAKPTEPSRSVPRLLGEQRDNGLSKCTGENNTKCHSPLRLAL
ncbi:unnamed protein product [Protopolystoma xenopodis]|uniref:Uncharacterized protein n=1 Tax=Protopolystoma xenopodis TaxID=117903 RepID=A0A448X6D7_9PLAT|nr:unnamed protein product [Protopolystoma xenopodis]